MDEVVDVLERILAELEEINSKLYDIKGYGVDHSIADVCEKLDSLEKAVEDLDF